MLGVEDLLFLPLGDDVLDCVGFWLLHLIAIAFSTFSTGSSRNGVSVVGWHKAQKVLLL